MTLIDTQFHIAASDEGNSVSLEKSSALVVSNRRRLNYGRMKTGVYRGPMGVVKERESVLFPGSVVLDARLASMG